MAKCSCRISATSVESILVVEVAPDGRVVRGTRNREAIVDALLSLYDEGVLRPSGAEVAQRAGVSARSLHNHFADMESLRAEVADRQWERVGHLTEPPPAGCSFDERVEMLVERRSAFFEAITPVRRAAMLSVHESPTIARRLARAARTLRTQLHALFAAELAGAPEGTLEAIDLCTSWDAWERLRTQQRLSVTAAKRVVASTLHALLDT
jgi:TetR/AcrR family transcriptional regulator, regulator of autoinduction and epiphytic fitness